MVTQALETCLDDLMNGRFTEHYLHEDHRRHYKRQDAYYKYLDRELVFRQKSLTEDSQPSVL